MTDDIPERKSTRPPGQRRPMPPSVPPRNHPVIPPAPVPRPQPSRQPASPVRAAQQPTRPAQQPQPRPVPTQPRTPAGTPRAARDTRRTHRVRNAFVTVLVLLLVATAGFWIYVERHITTVDALSGAANTAGETYLIVGSDSREGWKDDGTEGARTDTIMMLHRPADGPTALISIPRDSYVEIPGVGANKINAAFALGGPQLLVQTVEQLTGLTVDHYVEVGFTGVVEIVDAVGGVELCYDEDVDDEKSHLTWTAGCHVVDGTTALAFSRMRYSDPLGDIGRTQRQRQVVSALAHEVMSPATVANPFRLWRVTNAGLKAFRVNDGTHAWDLAQMALAFRSAMGDDAVTGTPPIRDLGYSVDGVGSTVLLDPDSVDQFWRDIAAGSFAPGEKVGGVG